MIDDISSDKQRFAQNRVVKPFPKVAIGSYFSPYEELTCQMATVME